VLIHLPFPNRVSQREKTKQRLLVQIF